MGGKTKLSNKEKENIKQKEKEASRKVQAEDEEWQRAGEGKKTKAQAKKDDKDASRQEALAKKAEAKRMLEEEEAKMSGAKSTPAKVTQHQLQQNRAKEEQLMKEEKERRDLQLKREMGEEDYNKMIEARNLNRDDSIAEASGVDAALSVLSVAEEAPKMKFSEYQARELPNLRLQKPGLKAPQYKDILWKKWLRSPENPLNKPTAA